jgi:hypothetical protein
MTVAPAARAIAFGNEQQLGATASEAPKPFHVFTNGRQVGPVQFEHVLRMARNGALRRSDFVWMPGLGQWTPAYKVAGLFPPSLFQPNVSSTSQPAPTSPPMPTPARKSRKRKSYLKRHWSGSISLAQAIYVNCILLWVVYSAVSYFLLAAALTLAGPNRAVLLLVDSGLYSFGWLLYIWGVVGAWRSSRRHVIKTGERIWPAIAQAYISLTVLLQLVVHGGIAALFLISRVGQ